MPIPRAELPPQYETVKDWIIALAKEGKDAKEIRKITGCSKSYAFRWYSYVQRQKEPDKPKEPKIELEDIKVEKKEEVFPEKEAEKPIELEEVVEPEVIPPEMRERIEEGMLTADDLGYLFQGVNEAIPEKHQRPEKAMMVLGKLGHKPVNRALAKYSGGNNDMLIFGLAAVITFLPAIFGVIRDWQESRRATTVVRQTNKEPQK